MELTEIIKHCYEVAQQTECNQCKIDQLDHLQIAKLLEELEAFKEEKEWHKRFSRQLLDEITKE